VNLPTNIMMNIWIINGPNLNLIGLRDINIYGEATWDETLGKLRSEFQSSTLNLHYFHSNHEGYLIDKLQEIGFEENTYGIINPGGLTHTSISLRDCIDAINTPFVEVHISDITNREEFRKVSYITDVCTQSIIGKGIEGYRQGINYLLARYVSM